MKSDIKLTLSGGLLCFSQVLIAQTCTPIEQTGAATVTTLSSKTVMAKKDICYTIANDNFRSYDIYANNFAKIEGLVILVHGGGWGSELNHKQTMVEVQMPEAVLELITSEYAVASINYRGIIYNSADEETLVDMHRPIEDVKMAISQIRSHHKYNNTPTDKVILIGSSAGSHLASLAATLSPISNDVKGVIAYKGPFEIRGPWSGGEVQFMYGLVYPVSYSSHPDMYNSDYNAIVKTAIGADLTEGGNKIGDSLYSIVQTHATDWSPLAQYSTHTSPHFFVHGTNDTLVSLRHSVEAYSQLKGLGVYTDFCFANNQGHNIFPNVQDEGCWEQAFQFMKTL